VSNNPKGNRLGNYICKVGYLDIRQKVVQPKRQRMPNGSYEMVGGKSEILIYHSKAKMAGPFKTKDAAIVKAKELVSQGIKYSKHK
jgi:hypothetical protein